MAKESTPARWYMLNKDGMATLCADKADAEQEAIDAQAAWPGMGPHRAVQLVEAGASLPLPGAQEAVATVFTMEALTPGAGVKYHATIHKLLPAGTKLYAAPQPALSAGWVSAIEAVAKMLEKKVDDFAEAHGSDDMGGLSFGRGAHADAKLDYHSGLLELAEEVRALPVEPSKDGESNADQA